jgi:hypothetical protein
MRCRSGVVITPPKSVMTPLYASDHYGFSAAKRLRSTSFITTYPTLRIDVRSRVLAGQLSMVQLPGLPVIRQDH